MLLFVSNSKAEEINIKYYIDDKGILSLMYHRFDENKYPSTNIQMDIFKKQMKIIRDLNYIFYDPGNLEKNFNTKKTTKKIDYYCFNFDDFKDSAPIKYVDVPHLCEKHKIKKNLINPIYLS